MKSIECREAYENVTCICKKQYFLEYVYAYTLVSRWLPNTLCHNVCGISSEPVTAVAVYSEISEPE